MKFINHLSVCRSSKICKKCGRIGCSGCIFTETTTPEKGLCVICSGMYTEDQISLHPPVDKTWNKESNIWQ